MLCINIIVNFVIITQYFFHIENTMSYMIYYLNIIYKTKESLREYYSKINFCFFKMHSLIHYIEYIRKFKSLSVFSFIVDEIVHRNYFKKFFNRINKCLNYKKQLFKINTRRMNLLTIVEFDLYKRETTLELMNDKETLYINKVLKVKAFDDMS